MSRNRRAKTKSKKKDPFKDITQSDLLLFVKLITGIILYTKPSNVFRVTGYHQIYSTAIWPWNKFLDTLQLDPTKLVAADQTSVFVIETTFGRVYFVQVIGNQIFVGGSYEKKDA